MRTTAKGAANFQRAKTKHINGTAKNGRLAGIVQVIVAQGVAGVQTKGAGAHLLCILEVARDLDGADDAAEDGNDGQHSEAGSAGNDAESATAGVDADRSAIVVGDAGQTIDEVVSTTDGQQSVIWVKVVGESDQREGRQLDASGTSHVLHSGGKCVAEEHNSKEMTKEGVEAALDGDDLGGTDLAVGVRIRGGLGALNKS